MVLSEDLLVWLLVEASSEGVLGVHWWIFLLLLGIHTTLYVKIMGIILAIEHAHSHGILLRKYS